MKADGLSVKRVHWLRARAMQARWREECIFVRYEMQWTVRYYIHKAEYWGSIATKTSESMHGQLAYARRKRREWLVLAHDADRRFVAACTDYESPI